MNKKILFVGISTLFFFGSCLTPALAQSSTIEAITDYRSQIQVNADNSVDVVETITYDTGLTPHHGIYRDIRTTSSQGKEMKISNVRVQDELGHSYRYELNNSPNNVRIKIGDPTVTFVGTKTYIVHYQATRAIG